MVVDHSDHGLMSPDVSFRLITSMWFVVWTIAASGEVRRFWWGASGLRRVCCDPVLVVGFYW